MPRSGPATPRGAAQRVARAGAKAATGTAAGAALLLAAAGPAAAHAVGGGGLPAPPWMLAYGAVAIVAIGAVHQRSRMGAEPGPDARGERSQPARGTAEPTGLPPSPPWAGAVGLAGLLLVVVVAVAGDDQPAGNVAPWAVLVVWWIALPIACLVAGDVFARVNPFAAVVALADRTVRRPAREAGRPSAAPTWTAAAFLAGFGWFLFAYHAPGSPRALAVMLAVYAIAAVVGGIAWGRAWLRTGEAFGAISASVAALRPWARRHILPAGTAALATVWLGGTVFDGVGSSELWADVVGDATGWERTWLNTLGLAWITAVVAGAIVGTARLAERSAGLPRGALHRAAGAVALPLALAWFLAHDLTLLVFDGQNALILASDPLGRGWDLFGTGGWFVEADVLDAPWLRWLQLTVLVVGHLAALAAARAHGVAAAGRQRAAPVLWSFAALTALSAVSAVLLLFAGVGT